MLQGWRAVGKIAQGRRSQHLAGLLCEGRGKAQLWDREMEDPSPETGVC